MPTPRTALLTAALAAAFLVPGKVAAASPPDPPAPAKPWEYPQSIQVAGRKVAFSEPVLLSRDPATGKAKARVAAKVTDALARDFWGSVEFEATTHLDLTGRLVKLDEITVGTGLQPQLTETDREQFLPALPAAFPKEFLIRLESLTAAPWAQPTEPQSSGKISLLAPEILVRTGPAALFQIDGEPVLQPVGDFPLEYVANSMSDIFRDPKAEKWFALADGKWFQAKAAKGPWEPLAGSVPVLLSQLPTSHPRAHIRRSIPGTAEFQGTKAPAPKAGTPAAPPAPVTEIIVRDKPAELVLILGEPLLTWIPKTKLMHVANTESDLFFHPKTNAYYLLVSGRWFQAEDVNGPWKESLGVIPEDFKSIPRDHPRGHVVWCVAGTPEASEASVRAMLEEKATFIRAIAIEVAFEGKDFVSVPIDGIDAKVVTNSDDEVFQAANSWWACVRGAWMESLDGKTWKPSGNVASALAGVHESSGVFHTRWCRALGASPDGFRYSIAGPYSGVFLASGAPVHGTGYWRKGMLRNGNWYPFPRTWGESRWYDPITGVFQPRTARYAADGTGAADEWSPYSGSYGRVRHFADRYDQGGRRMFTWNENESRFDPNIARPDIYLQWGSSVKSRDGIPGDKYPLGDRTGEAQPKEPPVFPDEQGTAWRQGEKGPETWDGKAWSPKDGATDEVKAWLAALTRIHRRAAEMKTWLARRAAPLPVNAVR